MSLTTITEHGTELLLIVLFAVALLIASIIYGSSWIGLRFINLKNIAFNKKVLKAIYKPGIVFVSDTWGKIKNLWTFFY